MLCSLTMHILMDKADIYWGAPGMQVPSMDQVYFM